MPPFIRMLEIQPRIPLNLYWSIGNTTAISRSPCKVQSTQSATGQLVDMCFYASAQATLWPPSAASAPATARSSTTSACQVLDPAPKTLRSSRICASNHASRVSALPCTTPSFTRCSALRLVETYHTLAKGHRHAGLGYCFSASLPPYLATAAIGALDMLQERKDAVLPAVTGNARVLRSLLAEVPGEDLLVYLGRAT